jgi:hypothetical protein
MLPEKIIFIAVLLNLIGSFWYIKDIILGTTRPNLVTWFIWMLAPFIGVFFQIKAGAGFSVLPIFMAGFISFLVIIISIVKKNSYWKINTFDLTCGVISFTALMLYIFTRNLNISILFAIMSDALAYIPTIKKSWSFPSTETGLMYTTGILSNVLGLLIIKTWTFPIYSFSVSIIILNFVILFCLYRQKILFWYND